MKKIEITEESGGRVLYREIRIHYPEVAFNAVISASDPFQNPPDGKVPAQLSLSKKSLDGSFMATFGVDKLS